MSLAFRSASSAVSGTATSATIARPTGASAGDLLVIVLGFEGVTGSGPFVSPNNLSTPNDHIGPGTGWALITYQGPSATGCGIEVWAAVNGGSGSVVVDFVSSFPFVAAMFAYTGEYTPNGTIHDNPVRVATSAQTTGNNPAAPSVYAYVQELVIACAADTVSGGYSSPGGYTQRLDAARGGSHGNVEIVVSDKLAAVEGDTGTITFTATASPAGAKGSSATFAVKPAVTLSPISGALSFRFRAAS